MGDEASGPLATGTGHQLFSSRSAAGLSAGQHAAGSAQKQQQESGSLLGSSKSQTITIKAPSKQALSNARTQVELLISNAINSRMMDFTHFVSLPLSNEHTAAKLQDFQDKVGCSRLCTAPLGGAWKLLPCTAAALILHIMHLQFTAQHSSKCLMVPASVLMLVR